jgi:hypothetical protein
MDPLALAAVVGLVFAGKKFADEGEETVQNPQRRPLPNTKPITRRDIDLMAHPAEHAADYFDLKIMTPDLGRRVGDWRLQPKQEVANLGDISKMANRYPFGQPVYDMSSRQYITNKMNNVPPIERKNVGPGLGVGADVPSTGGFHQYFRALPTNVNEEKLTTLEGREGPPNPFIKNGGTIIGDITHQAKETKAWARQPAHGRAGGQGGALTGTEGRPEFLKTLRTTIRQETGMRTDTQEFGPAQYKVTQPYATGQGAYTDTALTRMSGNRENGNRPGNSQRMNVRNDPVNQVGAMSTLRPESVPVPVGPVNGSRFQNYQAPDYDKFCEKKANRNPLANPNNLDIAIRQLENNPIAQPALAVV